MIKSNLIIGAVFAALVLVPALGQAQAVRGDVLTVALANDPPTLDPVTNTNNMVAMVSQNVFETLYTYDAKWNIVPMLASALPTFADGGKTVTIPLRSGVIFHNGKTMTADDVVASLERWLKLSPRLGKPTAVVTESVAATGPLTIQMKLKQPYAPLEHMLAFFSAPAAIMPADIARAAPSGPITDLTQLIGTGPYRFIERRVDQYIRLEKFDKYSALTTPASGMAGKREALASEVRFIPVPNATTRMQSVLSGQYLVADALSTESYNEVKANPNVTPQVVENGGLILGALNMKQGITTNLKIRQAVLAAMDTESMMLAGFGSKQFYSASSSYYPEGTPFHSKAGAELYGQKNVQKAKQLLAEAGYKGEPFRILTGTQYDFVYKAVLVFAENLRAAGINVKVEVMDWAAMLEKRYDPAIWECFFTLAQFVPEPNLIVTLSPAYAGWWDTDTKKAALEKLNTAIDPAQRVAAWHDIQRLTYDEAATLIAGTYFGFRAYSNKVSGVENLIQSPFWNVSVKP